MYGPAAAHDLIVHLLDADHDLILRVTAREILSSCSDLKTTCRSMQRPCLESRHGPGERNDAITESQCDSMCES